MVKPTTLANIGPLQHGVRMHATVLADHTPQAPRIDGDITHVLPQLVAGEGPVHCHFTDRVFGRNPAEAAHTVVAIAAVRPVSVTLHDIPQPSDGHAFEARCTAYARVVSEAHTVIVSSNFERDLLFRHTGVPDDVTVHVDPLPIDRARAASVISEPPAVPTSRPTVGLLGFIYPGKGHGQVLAALESSARVADVAALGRASDGHQDLVAEFERAARSQGRNFHVTGFLSEHRLTASARAVTVPVVAPEHVSASGSVGRWIASGRRPLVTQHPFFEELHDRAPWALTLTADLPAAIEAALADPSSTWIHESEWNYVAVPSSTRAARTQWARLTGGRAAEAANHDPDELVAAGSLL